MGVGVVEVILCRDNFFPLMFVWLTNSFHCIKSLNECSFTLHVCCFRLLMYINEV